MAHLLGRLRLSPLAAVPLLVACGSDDEKKGGDAPVVSLFADREPDDVHELDVGARIDIARDELGIPHIFAHSLEDASFAQGYTHARDRFFQMDLFRHNVEGRLTEYFGAALVDVDVNMRSKLYTRDGRPVWDAIVEDLDPDVKKQLEAYARGVNAILAEMRSGDRPLPAGYDNALTGTLTIDEIPDWTVEDTIAVSRLQQMQLSESSGEDIARADLVQALPADLAADLVRYAPADPTAILPEFYDSPDYRPASLRMLGTGGADAAAATSLFDLYRGIDFKSVLAAIERNDVFGFEKLMPREIRGSNNWVVAGAHTDSGHPMVFNDPHLFFAIPPLFYHSHMDTAHYEGDEGSSVMGISFPGIPSVLIGHNQFVAWGATVVGWDVTDVYVEQVNAEGTAVMFNGEWVDIQRADMEMKVRNGETQIRTVEIVPHHGPILPGTKANGRALSMRWTGQEAQFGGRAFLDAMRSRDIDEWVAAMEQFDVGAQNWNGADIEGDTAYAPYALVPKRASVTGTCNPTLPVDGTGPCEWTGFMTPGEIPHVKNRAKGYVVTANNDVTGTLSDNDPTNDEQYLHSSRANGFRAARITERIEELIEAGEGITLERMQALQADTASLEARRLVPFVLAAAEALPDEVTRLELRPALDRLSAWDLTLPSGVEAEYRTDGGPDAAEIEASIAASIFNAFLSALRDNVFADELGPLGLPSFGTRELLFLLENPTTSRTGLTLFDDVGTTEIESADLVILQSLRDGIDVLTTKLGADEDGWRWGHLHKVEMQDLFGQFGAAQRTFGPFPRPGGNETVDVANAGADENGEYIYRAGPQMRFYAVLDPAGIKSGSSLPGGQIDDPESPHYDDLLPGWLRNEAFEYHFAPEDVVENAEELVVIEPPLR